MDQRPSEPAPLADTDHETVAGGATTTDLKLQAAMDRRSKFMEATSNIMKSTSDTQGAIVGNLK